jgi:hypothetical protein
MNESIWMLFPKFLSNPFDRIVIGIKMFRCRFFVSRSSWFSGLLGDFVDSGVASFGAGVLAQYRALIHKE